MSEIYSYEYIAVIYFDKNFIQVLSVQDKVLFCVHDLSIVQVLPLHDS